VKPARVPELATVADTIRARIVAERAEAAARAAGEQFLADGQAATGDAQTETLSAPQTVSRRVASDLSSTVLNAVMRAPAAPLPAYVGVQDGDRYVVARIDTVTAAEDNTADDLTALRDELTVAWGRLEEAAVLRLLREQYQTQVQPAARAVLQAQPDGML